MDNYDYILILRQSSKEKENDHVCRCRQTDERRPPTAAKDAKDRYPFDLSADTPSPEDLSQMTDEEFDAYVARGRAKHEAALGSLPVGALTQNALQQMSVAELRALVTRRLAAREKATLDRLPFEALTQEDLKHLADDELRAAVGRCVAGIAALQAAANPPPASAGVAPNTPCQHEP
jgi:hypothetical protein